MFGYLFDSNNRKKKRDNIERYDDKRRKDNNRGSSGNGNGGEGDDDRGSGSKGPNRQNLMIMLLATVIALVVISYVMNMGTESATRISYNEFVKLVDEGKVEEVRKAGRRGKGRRSQRPIGPPGDQAQGYRRDPLYFHIGGKLGSDQAPARCRSDCKWLHT